MKNRVINYALALAMAGGSIALSSCDDDDDNNGYSYSGIDAFVNLKSDVDGAVSSNDLDGCTVTLTSVQSKDTYTFDIKKETLDENANGKVKIYIPIGTYDVSLEKTIDGKTIFVRKENVTIKDANQTIDVKLIATVAQQSDYQFIFSEVFFNGERNAGRMMHPDQYMVLYNPTNNILYADGLAVGCTMQASCTEKESWYDEYYNAGKVPVHGIIVIPGSGYDHPVKPHEKLVIAFTAKNHKETEGSYEETDEATGEKRTVTYKYDNAVDLSGADFEIYEPQLYTSDVDNPEVPNVKEIYPAENDFGGIGGFYQHPRGFYCPFIFKLKNGEQATLDEFFAANTSVATVKDKENNNVEIQMLSVKADLILDGITTGHIPSDIVTNPLPQSVDRGKQLGKGCHSGLLVQRKGNDAEGYKDTNNSTDDCEIVEYHNAFPVGWRNK